MNTITESVNQSISSEKVRYSVICDRFPSPQTYFDTFETAKNFAEFDQPKDRPHYVIKCIEHYELCGVVN